MSTARAAADWFGVVNLNKPAGWTSRKAVDHVKRIVEPAKIGHAGTLDPLARGVLVLCLGQATRLVPYLHELPKTYHAKFLLGRTSPTDDTEVDVEILENSPDLSREQIESALPRFVGEIEQVPPAYSAVKLKGKRAYELARRGKTPQIQPRTVHIEQVRLIDWQSPGLELEIVCGSGTYIRSIGRDLAESLGSGAVMSDLLRTAIGLFTLAEAVAPEDLTARSLSSYLQPAQSALVGMPQVVATVAMQERLQRGLNARCPQRIDNTEGTEVAVLDEDRGLLLIAVLADRGHTLKPRQVFVPKSGRLG